MERRRATEAEREASRWIARLEASDVSLVDHKKFRAWLGASPENRAAYEAVSKAYDVLDVLKFDPPVVDAVEPSRRRILFAGAGVAAVAVVGVALVLRPGASSASVLTTRIGERRTETLADGTRVELNADTGVRVSFTDRARSVELERGEALFDIAPDPARAFTIQTGFGDLICEEGSMCVKRDASFARATILSGEARADGVTASASIAAHTELLLSHAAPAVTGVSVDVVQRRVAWRDGVLAFDGEPLREAAADVTRQTGVRFEFEGSAGDLPVGGLIQASDVGAFISLMQTNLNLEVIARGDDRFVVRALQAQ